MCYAYLWRRQVVGIALGGGILTIVVGALVLSSWQGTTAHYLNIPYVPLGEYEQTLDLYVPIGKAGMPLLIWIHGGGWDKGSKEDPPILGFIRDGFAIASVNYRLSSTARFPAQIQDCKAAVRWLRANAGKYHLNPDRFIAIGASAGGHLAALLATTSQTREFDVGENLGVSSRLEAVVDFYGPTDMTTLGIPLESRVVKLLGCLPSQCEDLARLASPVTWISRDSPPFLIIHGEEDKTVPFGQSTLLRDLLDMAGVPVWFYKAPGGHDSRAFESGMQKVKGFLNIILSLHS